MADFTPQVEHDLRQWVGSQPELPELEALWRFSGESVPRCALGILRARRAQLVSLGPGEWSVQGDYSQKYTAEQLAALDKDIRQLALQCDDPSVAADTYRTIPLERAGYCGR